METTESTQKIMYEDKDLGVFTQEVFRSSDSNMLVLMVGTLTQKGKEPQASLCDRLMDVVMREESDEPQDCPHPFADFGLPEGYIIFGMDSLDPFQGRRLTYRTYSSNYQYRRDFLFLFLAKPNSLMADDLEELIVNDPITLRMKGLGDSNEFSLSIFGDNLRLPEVARVVSGERFIVLWVNSSVSAGLIVGKRGWRIARLSKVCKKQTAVRPVDEVEDEANDNLELPAAVVVSGPKLAASPIFSDIAAIEESELKIEAEGISPRVVPAVVEEGMASSDGATNGKRKYYDCACGGLTTLQCNELCQEMRMLCGDCGCETPWIKTNNAQDVLDAYTKTQQAIIIAKTKTE